MNTWPQQWAAYCTDCNEWLNREHGDREEVLFAVFEHLQQSAFKMHAVYMGYRIGSIFKQSNYLAFRLSYRVSQLADVLDTPGTDEEKIRWILEKINQSAVK